MLLLSVNCEFENLIFEGKIYLTSFPCAKARKSRQHTIHVLEDKQLNAATIHVGMNDLLSNIMSINEIYTI